MFVGIKQTCLAKGSELAVNHYFKVIESTLQEYLFLVSLDTFKLLFVNLLGFVSRLFKLDSHCVLSLNSHHNHHQTNNQHYNQQQTEPRELTSAGVVAVIKQDRPTQAIQETFKPAVVIKVVKHDIQFITPNRCRIPNTTITTRMKRNP